MEAKEMTVLRPENEKSVHLEGVQHTQYGPKMYLGGDTYDLLSRNGEDIADDLEFREHHCAWNSEVESWTIKPADESIEALAAALEDAGYRLNGVAGRLADHLLETTDSDGGSWWADKGIRVRAVYESKQSGNEMEKEGVVSAVDPAAGTAEFRRDDGAINTLRGNAIYSQSSHYPYMGDITEIEVKRE